MPKRASSAIHSSILFHLIVTITANEFFEASDPKGCTSFPSSVYYEAAAALNPLQLPKARPDTDHGQGQRRCLLD